MAKIKHSSPYEVIDQILTSAKARKIMHLSSQEEEFNGDILKINDQELINFGTCGYLGLEKHPHVLAKSRDLLERYGTQFSVSRAFIKAPYLIELEGLLSQIFDNHPVIIYSSTSITHQSVLGAIIQPTDLIILDQQVHYSVQYPCHYAKLQGTMVKMIRHNNMEMLEDFIKKSYNLYDKIWYMADGVYSMFGDLPRHNELLNLLDKYPKLHLYFDDAHGVGWTGVNGSGTVFELYKDNPRVVLISTLAKGFGAIGGLAVFNDPELYRKNDIYGGVLSYTHPLSPSNIGAAIGVAELLLSDQGLVFQNELKDLMDYLNSKLEAYNLTNISSNNTPIYFIAAGSLKVTHNLIQKMISDGFYVNTATYPVVPNDKTGLRFTLTRHNTKEHIDRLVESIATNFVLAVEEENEDIELIYKTFNVPFKGTQVVKPTLSNAVRVETYTTIDDVNPKEWDALFENNGNYSHNGLKCLEEIFSNNEKPEENWDFHYLILRDSSNEILLATFFTAAIFKDDLFAPANVSKKIEQIRIDDPYYLCSKTLAMGCLLSEGNHLYINENHLLVKETLDHFFIELEKIKISSDSVVVVLRDFMSNFKFNDRFEADGFIKVGLPNTNIVENPKWNTADELLAMTLSSKSRSNIRKDVLRYQDQFDIRFKKRLSEAEALEHYQLFLNVKQVNYAVNFFNYPSKITSVLSNYKEWEFIELRIKGSEELIGTIWGFVGGNCYCPLIVGLNYHYNESHNLYKQMMFQMVKRGNDLEKKRVYLGLTSDFEKKKYGAKLEKIHAFIKVDETYNLDIIATIS